jgi:hypothetical protein
MCHFISTIRPSDLNRPTGAYTAMLTCVEHNYVMPENTMLEGVNPLCPFGIFHARIDQLEEAIKGSMK